jgi:dolichol-phosphate mannosyltransferase
MRFCLVGASGVVVNYLTMWAAYDGLGLAYVLASIVAYILASANNFAWNKLFTFKDKVTGLGPVFVQYLKFISVTLPGLAINEGVLVALVELTGMDPVWANLAGVLLATVSNFIGNKYFAFRRPPGT